MDQLLIDFYKDIPAPYAVFRVLLNEEGDQVVDAEYVYVNDAYCSLSHRDRESLIGKSFLSVYDQSGTDSWFSYCYQAAVEQKTATGFLFSPEIQHWLKFNVAPAANMPGCCTFIFMNVDRFRDERDFMIRNWATEDFLISMAKMFSLEDNYETMMNRMLDLVSQVVHADRIYIMEKQGESFSNTFEWCRNGVTHEMENLQNLDASWFRPWEKMVQKDSAAVIPNVKDWKQDGETMYTLLEQQDIQSVLAIPMDYNGKLIGYLCADNYCLEESVDAQKILETVSLFAASKIANHRLMVQLDHLGSHDALTGLLNRRGVQAAMEEYLREHPGETFSCVYLDIDDFKRLNDQLGHAAGDAALMQFAEQLRSGMKDEDVIIGRLGGDEFLLFLKGSSRKQAEEKVMEFCRMPRCVHYEEKNYTFRISAGIAQYPDADHDIKRLIRKADDALYHSKLYNIPVTTWTPRFENDAPKDGNPSAQSVSDGFFEQTVQRNTHRITGLPGLHHFFCAVSEIFARDMADGTYGRRCTVYFNVSHFKVYNELNGIRKSDQTLFRLGREIQNAFPDQVIAHINADHFCVLAYMDHVIQCVEQVCEKADRMFNNPMFRLKAGICNSSLLDTEPAYNESVTMDMAKTACDSIKNDDLRSWAIYTDEMRKRYQYRTYVLKNFERALEQKEITVYYQPVVRAYTGEVCGYEALARWESPDMGMLMPDVFISTLEEANLIPHLDAYVIQTVGEDLQERRLKNLPVASVSVNLSRIDFTSTDLLDFLDSIVQERGLQKSDLCLEVTETAMIRDSELLRYGLKRLHDAGYRLFLDDFGSGCSSFGVLKDCAFHAVKIDQAFLRDFSDRSREIIASIVSMSKALGMHTLAEGAETEEQVRFLKEIGCEMIQGYYYGKPEPKENLAPAQIEKPYTSPIWDQAGFMKLNPSFSTAICVEDHGELELVYMNSKFREAARKFSRSSSGKQILGSFDQCSSELKRRLRHLFMRAQKTGRLEDMTFQQDSDNYHLFIQHLAGEQQYHVYYLEFYRISNSDKGIPDR